MPNKKAKNRKIRREEMDRKLSKNGRTPGQIARAKRKAERKSSL
jgi:hypothetical protein